MRTRFCPGVYFKGLFQENVPPTSRHVFTPVTQRDLFLSLTSAHTSRHVSTRLDMPRHVSTRLDTRHKTLKLRFRVYFKVSTFKGLFQISHTLLDTRQTRRLVSTFKKCAHVFVPWHALRAYFKKMSRTGLCPVVCFKGLFQENVPHTSPVVVLWNILRIYSKKIWVLFTCRNRSLCVTGVETCAHCPVVYFKGLFQEDVSF